MNFNHDSGSITSILTIDTTVAPPLGGSNTLQIIGTGGLALPSGTSAQRPAGVPAGTQRWNSETSKVEVYNGSTWDVDGGGTVTSVAVASDSGTALTVTGSPITGSGTITIALSGELENFSNISASADGPVVRLDDGTYVAREFVAASGSAVIITNGDGQGGNPTFSLDAQLENIADVTTTGFLFINGGTDSAVTKTFNFTGDLVATEDANVITVNYVASGAVAGLDAVAGNGILVQTAEDTYAARSIEGTAGNIVVTNGDGVAGNPIINLATVTQAATGTFSKVTLDGFGRVTGNTAVVASDITSLVDDVYLNVSGDTMEGNIAMDNNKIVGLGAPTAGTDAANKNYVDAMVAGLSWKQAVRAATTGDVVLAPAPATVDGVTLVSGDRVLVRAQNTAAQNGIYTFDGTNLVRSDDMNEAAEFSAATVFVQEGTTLADTGWTQTAEVVTVGTTSVSFVQFTGSGTYAAGLGLSLDGNTFNVNFGAGISQLPSDEVGIDILNPTAGALRLQLGGVDSTDGDAKLTLLLKAAGGLTQDADGLYIPASGVTNAMLANSSITVTGTSGSDATALGESLAIVGAGAMSTAVTADTVTISVANATETTVGVASFAAADFTVTAGEVTLDAKGINWLTDVETSALADGDLLVYNATNSRFENVAQSTIVPELALDDLTDVVITSPATGAVLRFDGTNWIDEVLSIQEADAGLTNLAELATTGIVVASAADTFVTRSLVAGTGISITNEDGVAGNITIANTGVTSVALSLPSIFDVTGSPVTTTGTLTGALAVQPANTVFAGPTTGADAAPTFRALVPADVGLTLYKENGVSPTAGTATGNNSIALGSASDAALTGEIAHASGSFAANGDAQSFEVVLRNATTDATATELFLDGSAARAVMANNTAWTFTVQVVGLRADGGAAAGYRFDGVALRGANAAATSFVGSPSKNILGETNAGYDATVTADTTNGALAVTVTGAAATSMRWVATIRATQVKF
jgi:hypothetical protein